MIELFITGVIAVLLFTSVFATVFAAKWFQENRSYQKRFSPVFDLDKELGSLASDKKRLEADISEIRSSYAEKRGLLDQLVEACAVYDETIELAELGFYRAHYDFDVPDRYKQEVERVRQLQKEMVRAKTAVTCSVEWTVEGSKSKGRTMINRATKLAARAFNNECDAAISSVRWNNAARLEARIEKAFDAINRLNETQSIVISNQYLALKLAELRLAHEYAEAKKRDRDEQAEIRAQMREEAKLRIEMEKSEKEEEKYERMLRKAKQAAERAIGTELEDLQAKINMLEIDLATAHAQTERAKSMAEQTRRGHVYVISNIGSFGDDVYKIGMTRRLEPLDRVRELGDASVPFLFDVHAIIYSDDAPTLERELHRQFDDRRINLVNNRKEFFRVPLREIQGAVSSIAPDAEFTETAEAQQYRESKALRDQRMSHARQPHGATKSMLPTQI